MSLKQQRCSKSSDSFPNEFTNEWRFHCRKWQGVPHAIQRFDHVVGQRLYRVSDGVRSTHGQDGAIVLDVHQGQMFNLNPVGSRILELLESGATEADIVETIVREFSASRDAVEKDVREFIGSLKEHKLVAER
jgi:hypothetical protein